MNKGMLFFICIFCSFIILVLPVGIDVATYESENGEGAFGEALSLKFDEWGNTIDVTIDKFNNVTVFFTETIPNFFTDIFEGAILNIEGAVNYITEGMDAIYHRLESVFNAIKNIKPLDREWWAELWQAITGGGDDGDGGDGDGGDGFGGGGGGFGGGGGGAR